MNIIIEFESFTDIHMTITIVLYFRVTKIYKIILSIIPSVNGLIMYADRETVIIALAKFT